MSSVQGQRVKGSKVKVTCKCASTAKIRVPERKSGSRNSKEVVKVLNYYYYESISGPEVLFQDLRRDEIRG